MKKKAAPVTVDLFEQAVKRLVALGDEAEVSDQLLAGLSHPKAMLYAEHADSVSLAGLLMDDVWNDRRVITIDLLGDEFIEAVKTGDPIAIHEDGTVEVG